MEGSDEKQEGLTEREIGLLAFGIALGSVLSVYLIPTIKESLFKAPTLIEELIVAIILVFILTLFIILGFLVANKVLALANKVYQWIKTFLGKGH